MIAAMVEWGRDGNAIKLSVHRVKANLRIFTTPCEHTKQQTRREIDCDKDLILY